MLTVKLTSVLFAIECVSAVIESVSAADQIYKEFPSFDLRWDEYKGSQFHLDDAYPFLIWHCAASLIALAYSGEQQAIG